MNRVERLHAILVHLQGKKRVTAQELADRFELSLRTVYRDIKALDESGIPVIGEAGIGYSIMEGYRLPPVMFTQEEASSLLLGSKFIQHFTDEAERKQFDSAMYKIKAVLRSADKEYVEELNEKIAINTGPVPIDESAPLHLTSMRQSIVEKRVIDFEYFSAYNEVTTRREVEPIGLFYYSQTWHCIAWCRLRKDYRDFRLDRISKLVLKEDKFGGKSHPSLSQYIQELKEERDLQEVIISFEKKAAKYILSQKYYYGLVSEEEKNGRIYMRFLSAHPQYLCRWLLTYTNAAKIESPSSLCDTIKVLLEELNQHYS